MFVVERLIGVTTYSLTLLLFCYLISKSNSNYVIINRLFKIYLVILVIFGFFFVPPLGADLTRINSILKIYSNYSFERIMLESRITSTPIANLIYWCVSKTGITGLISAISSFVVFYNIFYIFYDYSFKNKAKCKNIAVALFIVMSTGFFMEVISTIRDMMAYSIILRCFYNELYNQKSLIKNIFLYVFAFLIHQSAIGIIGIRIIYYVLFERKVKMISKIVVTSFIVILTFFMMKYISMSTAKYAMYMSNKTYSLIWEYIKAVLELITILIIVFSCSRIGSKLGYLNKHYRFNLLLAVFTLFFIKEYSIFVRFTYFNIFMSIPVIIYTFNNSDDRRFKSLVIILSLCMLGLSCTRCDLSSLKFFVIGR